MRQLPFAALLAFAASAQTAVSPPDIPEAKQVLAPTPNEKPLRCDVDRSKAELNFASRFQSGYVMGVPLVQYSGAGHSWRIFLRVTPEGGDPAYFTDRLELPAVVDSQYVGQTSGTFLLGEGHYEAEFAVVDDKGRVCRKEWTLDAAIGRGDRAVKVAMPPHTVASLSSPGSAPAPRGNPAPHRLTILLNGSEPYQPWLSPIQRVVVPHTAGPTIETPMDYRSALIGILAALLERLPGTTIRLVVFDLDQQKETFRQDDFTLKDIEKAAHAANSTDHWVVTVRELQERVGPWELLANLVRREIHAPEPSDAVLMLGPRIKPLDKMPAHFLEDGKGSLPRFFYMQYRLKADPIYYGIPASLGNKAPDDRRSAAPLMEDDGLTPEVADPIESLVSRLKGKTLMVHSPVDFAKAVEALRQGAPH